MFVFIGLVSAFFYGFATYSNRPYLAVIGLVISLGQAVFAYFGGEKLAIMQAGGVLVTEDQSPQIHNMVENLAKISGIPKPKIYISPDPSPNAFACGRDPQHASMCLNQGILDLLDKNELEGVIAHELSHVANRDILVMTVTMVLASVISFVADMAVRAMWWGGGDNNGNGENKSPIIFIFYILALVLAPIVSLLIQMAISRSRESLADASAIVITRYPKGLMDALTKLYESPVPTNHYSTATSHFYIAPPKQQWGEKVQSLFSTHPPLKDRIEALRKLS
jgi:heat shock protein HtpX